MSHFKEELAALKTKVTQLEDQQKQARNLLKTLQAATQKQDTWEHRPPHPSQKQDS